MSTKNEAFDKIRDILSEYSAEMNFAMASEYARRCEYSQAETLLLPHGKIPDSTRELDLLARISANKGSFTTAIKFWSLALEKEPDNQAFKEDIAAIETMLYNRKMFRIPYLFMYTIIVIFTLFIINMLISEWFQL